MLQRLLRAANQCESIKGLEKTIEELTKSIVNNLVLCPPISGHTNGANFKSSLFDGKKGALS